ncbi:MAG: hypothetical protein DRP34_00170 [Thermodesulfobacteriota bacterium]|mgnify:CR=1 FL=1|nr:MAG: hypothetical protein DRP34_00170 [Thermodesulfobacteriota bacterium]
MSIIKAILNELKGSREKGIKIDITVELDLKELLLSSGFIQLKYLKDILEICKAIRKWMESQKVSSENAIYCKIIKLQNIIQEICYEVEKGKKEQ